MILVKREPNNLFVLKEFEDCSFNCGEEGRFWHEETNLPFCQPCAKEKRLDDLFSQNGTRTGRFVCGSDSEAPVHEKINPKLTFPDFKFKEGLLA